MSGRLVPEEGSNIMNSRGKRLVGAVLLAALLAGTGWFVLARADEPAAKLDAAKIGEAAGTKATNSPDGVVRIAWARTDVAVTVDGMPLKPFAGLGSWAAFAPAPHGAIVMGDTLFSRMK
jgi:hypothetical protein